MGKVVHRHIKDTSLIKFKDKGIQVVNCLFGVD